MFQFVPREQGGEHAVYNDVLQSNSMFYGCVCYTYGKSLIVSLICDEVYHNVLILGSDILHFPSFYFLASFGLFNGIKAMTK